MFMGVIWLRGEGRASFRPAAYGGPSRDSTGYAEIVRAFKTFSARRINELRGTPGIAGLAA